LLAALSLPAAYTIYRAFTLRVEYHDGFAYLVNARYLAGDRSLPYAPGRPPLVSLLQIPVVKAASLAQAPGPWLMVAPHVLSAVLSLLAALAVFFAYRSGLGPAAALLGVLLFATTRLFIRYGAHVMTDLPVAGLSAAAVALYSAAIRSGRFRTYALAGAALGATISTKYSAALLALALVLATGLLAFRVRQDGARRRLVFDRALRPWLGLLLVGLATAAVFAAIHAPVFWSFFGPHALREFLPSMRAGLAAVAGFSDESRKDYLVMLVEMASPAGTLLALGGIAVALARPQRRDAIFAAWLAVVGGGIVLLVGHNEARYLFPAVPPLFYFAARAVEFCWERWRRPLRPRRTAAMALALVVGLAGLSMVSGAAQAWDDRDRFFRTDIEGRAVELAAQSVRGRGRLLLLGTRHTLSPRDPGPVPADEFWNVFHYVPPIPAYFLGRPLAQLGLPSASVQVLRPLLAAWLRDGDAVLRLDGLFYSTKTFPEGPVPRPLEVWSIARLDLVPAPGRPGHLTASQGTVAATLADDPGAGAVVFAPDQSLGERAIFVKNAAKRTPDFVRFARLERNTAIVLPTATRVQDVEAIVLIDVAVRRVGLDE